MRSGSRWTRDGVGGNGAVTAPSLAPAERSLVRMSAALACGREEALRSALAEAARAAGQVEVEEALLQSYLFLGYPAALSGLALWREVGPAARAASTPDDWPGWARRGADLCRRVYSTRYRELRDNIRRLHPDMERWMVVEGYGKVLGRPGLAPRVREYCIVALLAVAGAGPQLYSHLRGALNLGAPARALTETLELAGAFMDDARSESAWATWRRVLSRREEGERAGRDRLRPDARDGGGGGGRPAGEAGCTGGAEG